MRKPAPTIGPSRPRFGGDDPQDGGRGRDLRARIREAAIRLRRREWHRRMARFGVFTLLLAALFTAALARSVESGVPTGGMLAAFLLLEAVVFLLDVVLPMRRPLDTRRVARFIDERHPELEDRILSATEFAETAEVQAAGAAPAGAPGDARGRSLWMIERCIEETEALASNLSLREVVRPGVAARSALVAFAFLLASGALVLETRDLWTSGLRSGAASPLAARARGGADYEVIPGDARVRVGDDQAVLVKSPTTGRSVGIEWRAAGEGRVGEWVVEPMALGADPTVHHHRFADVRADLEYRVRFGGEVSRVFRLTAWTPPEVASIDLSYRYPEYLKLAPREVPNGGAIAAVEGTRVALAVETNKPVREATVALKSGERVPLARAGATVFEGELLVSKDDAYKVELIDLDGAASEYDPEYAIRARIDTPPRVKLEFPRGDMRVTSLDEVPFAFEVTDDFGIADFAVDYEIVGRGAESMQLGRNAGLTGGEGEAVLAARGDTLVEMEKFGLAPGDLITWSVRASDRKPDRPVEEGRGDVFFLEIRPFRETFEEAVSEGGQGGGAPPGGGAEADQKKLIVATWNLRRDYPTLDAETYRTNRTTIHDAQAKLAAELDAASSEVPDATAAQRKDMAALREAMALALHELTTADLPAPAEGLGRAIARMQEAYRLILRTAPTHSQVMRSRGGRSGGAGGARPDLEALEMDRNRNFYEEESSPGEESAANDEALDALSKLAQRQQMINEEIARLVSELERAKDDAERDRLRRELERLRDEQKKALEKLDEVKGEMSSGAMDGARSQEASERLDRSREDMNKALENLKENRLQEARAAGKRAEAGLDELRDDMRGLSREAAARRMQELREAMEELRREQAEVASAVEAMKEEGAGARKAPDGSPSKNPQAADAEARREDTLARKKEVSESFRKMMEEAGDLSEKASRGQELMSRRLGDWLRETSRAGVLEDLEESRPLVQYGAWDSAAAKERGVEKKLEEAARGLDRVAEAMVSDDVDAMRKALERLEEVVAGAGEKGAAGERGEGRETASAGGSREGERESEDADASSTRSTPSTRSIPSTSPHPDPATDDTLATDRARGASSGEPRDPEREAAIAAAEAALADAAARRDAGRSSVDPSRAISGEIARRLAMEPDGPSPETVRRAMQRALAENPEDARAMEELARSGEMNAERRAALERLSREMERNGATGAGDAVQEVLDEIERAVREGGRDGRESRDGRDGPEGREPGEGRSREMAEARPGEGRSPGERGQGEDRGERGDSGDAREPGASGEPGDSGEPGEGEQGEGREPGDSPGEGGEEGDSREGRGGASGDRAQGDRPGSRPGDGVRSGDGDGDGSPGSEPGDSTGERGEQGARGEGGQRGQGSEQGQGDRDGQAPRGAGDGGSTRGGEGGPGGGRWDVGALRPGLPRDMRQWAETDYRDWLEGLRDAEALLPRESDRRREIERVREEVERMRDEFRKRDLAPKYDLFLAQVVDPLAEAAGKLERELIDALKEREFVLVDEGDAPAQYRELVADYFESLSAIEAKGPASDTGR